MKDLVNSYNSLKLELPENYSNLSKSKKRKCKSQYNPKWKKDYPWIEEVRTDSEVRGIVCKICRIKTNFRSYDAIQQRRRNNGKFVTVPFTKMGNFYEQARVHEFGTISAVDPVEYRKKVCQGTVSIPTTAHTKFYLSSQTEQTKKHHVDNSMFNLHCEICARNETAMMQLFSILPCISKRRDSPFASLKGSVLFSIDILGCDSLKSLLKEDIKGISNRKIDEMITCIYI